MSKVIFNDVPRRRARLMLFEKKCVQKQTRSKCATQGSVKHKLRLVERSPEYFPCHAYTSHAKFSSRFVFVQGPFGARTRPARGPYEAHTGPIVNLQYVDNSVATKEEDYMYRRIRFYRNAQVV